MAALVSKKGFDEYWIDRVFLCQATEIGKAVNRLRKHASKEIRHLARTLIEYGNIFSGLLQLIYAIYVYWHEIKCLIMGFWDNICVSIYLLPLWTSYLPSIVALSSVYYHKFFIGCIDKQSANLVI